MSAAKKQSTKLIAVSVVVVLLLAAGVWGLVAASGDSDSVSVPENVTLAAIQLRMDDPEGLTRAVDEVWDREDVTDEQRSQIMRNFGKAMQTRMNENLDEWFNAPPDQKNMVMDRHLDQFQKGMKVMETNRDKWRKRMEELRERRKAAGENVDEDEEGGPSHWRGRMNTQQERKSMAESGDPDRFARMSMYWGAAMARMKERGIEMPWGRGGRDGGRSGRRGGGQRGR